MTSTRRFPWIWASFFLLVGIAGLIAFDVSRAGGSFPKSATGRLFNDLGILEPTQRAWQKSLSASARGYIWLENNAPVYYKRTAEVCSPYIQLSKDLAVIAGKRAAALYGNTQEYIAEKAPVVRDTVEQYAPGLIVRLQGYGSTVLHFAEDYYKTAAEYLKTKVFVGEWAPEILQNKTQTALNVTATHVSTYFHWFRQQVQVYSKIP